MVRRKRSLQDEPHEHEPETPAGAEGASSFGQRRPAGDDVLGEAERPDQPGGMERVERTTDVTPPAPITPAGRRERQASRRLARKKGKTARRGE